MWGSKIIVLMQLKFCVVHKGMVNSLLPSFEAQDSRHLKAHQSSLPFVGILETVLDI